MKCPKCGAEMKSTKCEYCQSEISQEELDNKRKEKRNLNNISHKSKRNTLICLMLVIILVATILIINNNNQKNSNINNKDSVYNNEDEKILESESITKRLNDQMESDKETLGNLTDESTTNVNRKITGATSISYDFIPDGSISDYLESGTYKCGSDFEPGEYYIYGFLGPSPSVRLSNAKDEGSWSGEDRALLKKMSFKDGDYFKMYSDLIMFPSDNIDSDKYNEFGIFIVGKDIMPGEYRVTNINDRYTGEFANASGEILGGIEIYENNTSIGENPIYSTNMFEKQYIVNLEIDQIVILVNAQLEQL